MTSMTLERRTAFMTNAAEGGKVWTPEQNIVAPIPPRTPSKLFWISFAASFLGMLMMISVR